MPYIDEIIDEMKPRKGAGQETARVPMHAFINAADSWLNEFLKDFIRQHVPDVVFIDNFDEFPAGAPTIVQFCKGLALHRDFAALNVAENGLLNAYPDTDALARRDCLAAVVDYWSAKHPMGILECHVPQTIRLVLDYSEYVDESLVEPDDLSLLYSLEKNENKRKSDRYWWILKPALVDCGIGIRLFSTVDELARHLELAEDEGGEGEVNEGEGSEDDGGEGENS